MRHPSQLLSTISILALAATPSFAQSVGVTAAVNQSAQGTRPVRTISLGGNVISNEQISTNDVGLVQILLKDGTAFTVGPRSQITIDRFVYDPNAGTAQIAATMTKGVFRFIGGKTSKTPNGVSLNTPVGTVGVRGAVVDLDLGGGGLTTGGSACPYPQHIDLIFGKEMTVAGNGQSPDRVYTPGYSIVSTARGQGGTRGVVKTPPECTSSIQLALSGKPGTNGGSSQQPTSETVVASRVADTNSDVTPAVNNPPTPTPRPEPPVDLDQAVIANASQDELRQDVVDVDVGGEERTVAVRVLTPNTSFTGVDNPGAAGLLGGSPESDEVTDLLVPSGSSTGTAEVQQGTLTLPVYDDSSFTTRQIAAASGASLNGQALTGTAYSGVGGFTTYLLAIDGDLNQPLYAIRGTPMPDTGLFQNGDIRTYAFTNDPREGVPVPFMEDVGLDYSGAAITDVAIVEGSGDGSNPRLLQTWLTISGAGADQTSGVGVNLGSFFESSDGSLQFNSGSGSGRRGSYRTASDAPSALFSGAVATVAGPAGGSQVFGPNGENLVVTRDIETDEFFRDLPADGNRLDRFSTIHVLNLTEETPAATFAADQGTTRSLGGITLSGFAAGTAEVYLPNSPGGNFTTSGGTSGSDLTNMQIAFDSNSNSIGGEIEIGDDTGSASLRIAFGDGINGNPSSGPSTYITDDMYGSARNLNDAATYLEFTEDGETNRYEQTPNENNRTYLVSGDAVPQTSLLPNGQLCDCQFLEWGWWGTQVRGVDAATGVDVARTSVHLGTWVAGDISTLAQVDAAVSNNVTATYSGNAVGSVVNGGANYIAAGSMNMQWNFGSRSGGMQIGNFDGRNFSGTLDLPGGSNGYQGFISESSGGAASGVVNGAFVNDGADALAGTIGNFDLETSGGGWSATGTFAGAQDALPVDPF